MCIYLIGRAPSNAHGEYTVAMRPVAGKGMEFEKPFENWEFSFHARTNSMKLEGDNSIVQRGSTREYVNPISKTAVY